MKPFCEVMVKEILPALRSEIAVELKNLGLNQSEIAGLLDVSQPAVSQYLRQLRGDKKDIFKDVIISNEIKKLSKEINDKKIDSIQLMERFCNICDKITSRGLVCGLHKKMYKLDNCKFCLTS